MNITPPTEGRASLARSYRNLSEREIRTKLDGTLGDAERATAKAELLRRGAGSDAVDTKLATGFLPTSAFDIDEAASPESGADEPGRGRGRVWLVVAGVVVAVAVAAAWVLRAQLGPFA